jgi:hypothetical protein
MGGTIPRECINGGSLEKKSFVKPKRQKASGRKWVSE